MLTVRIKDIMKSPSAKSGISLKAFWQAVVDIDMLRKRILTRQYKAKRSQNERTQDNKGKNS